MTEYVNPNFAAPARPTSNGLGIAGFIVSLVGFISCGILSPIGLLLSLIALFRPPRGFAVAGFILGLIGSIIPAIFIAFFGLAIFSVATLGKPGFQTLFAMGEAQTQIDSHVRSHGNALPDDADGQAAIASDRDGWGHPLRYTKTSASRYELRSAGPDGIMGNSDDQVQTPHKMGVGPE
jgi:hypothetical protein